MKEYDKPKTTSYMIQIWDQDIEPMIKALASEDMRSIGNEVAWMIRAEYFNRHPKPLLELNSHASSIAETQTNNGEMS